MNRFSTTFLAPLLLLAGCNLTIDLESYPYPAPFQVDPLEPDAATGDLEALDVEDPGPTIGPRLLITEVMVRPSSPPHTNLELGEYIEIRNVGDEPIHPREIVIEILETNDRIYVDRIVSSPQEHEAVSALKPIEPGGFFLFLRQDDPYYRITEVLEEGTYYEYGRWHRSISLSNFSRTLRLIEIRDEFGFHIHHEIGWREGFLVDLDQVSSTRLDIRTDIAFGLRSSINDSSKAGDPDNWCYHVTRFSDGPLLGSPGRRTPDSCL